MTAAMKYNPAFLADEPLIAGFAVRGRDLDAILELVEDNTGPANQHIIVIGPRGAGKTTLALRVAAELRRDPARAGGVYPIVFAEESYEVHDAATLWLQALFHVGRQTGVARWQAAYERLRAEADPARVRLLALAELHEFSEAEGKRLLLIVENFNVLVDRQIAEDEAWTLRHTLLNDRSIMLLATATSRFDGIDHREQAMFDLFRVFTLDPLASHECVTLWHRLTGRSIDERQGRALEILTGGNPRLLTIMSRVAADAPLHTLADDLTRLIDDQTAYFKSQIDALPPQMQRVFVALAEMWAPAAAQEIAERARLPVNTVSAVLGRLEQNGAVTADATSPRRKRYQLSERLYNIYYQMRRGGAAAERVRYAVEFIAAYYDPNTIVEKLLVLADEAVNQPPARRVESIITWFTLYEQIGASHVGLLLPRLSAGFRQLEELTEDHRRRLDTDEARARADLEWFMDLWREWWDSHRMLREGWAAVVAQPLTGACWAELARSMRGESGPTKVGLRIGEQLPAILGELRRLRPSLRALCHRAVQEPMSWIDVLVAGALALWLEDEALFVQVWRIAAIRWPTNPWVRLTGLGIEHLAIREQPRRFAREARALLSGHADSVWLPLAVGLILDIDGDEPTASAFYQTSPLSSRVVGLVQTLLQIRVDFLEREFEIVMQPRWAGFAWLISRKNWIDFLAWLARFTVVRLDRPNDSTEILTLAAEHFPESVELQLALGCTLFFHNPERAEEGLALLRRAATHDAKSWQLGAAIAAVHAYPLAQFEAALRGFEASWRGYMQACGDEKHSAEAWLEPVTDLLPGHPVVQQFLALLQPPRRALEADLKRLLAERDPSQDRQQALISLVIALATRGDASVLLERLQGSAVAASLEPLIVALHLVAGQEIHAPREISETARDIATSIYLYSSLYRLIGRRPEPTAEPQGASKQKQERRRRRRRG